MATDTTTTTTTPQILTHGSEYLKKNHPDFKLVGRDEELKKMTGILMRQKANNVLLVGPGGSGCSAMCVGLQASKGLPDTPVDLINKGFYWLDIDLLFSSGNSTEINESFGKVIRTLANDNNTVLVIPDMKGFIEAARNSGCSNIINSLMSEVRKENLQAIFEVRDQDLDFVLKAHSDLVNDFTLMDMPEPSQENLKLIVDARLASLEAFHGIKIAPEAAEQAIMLTNKYSTRDASLNRSQPERALTLIDRAFTSYRQKAHSRPIIMDTLESNLVAVEAAIQGSVPPSLADKTPSELENLKASISSDIQEVYADWAETQAKLKKIYKQIRGAQDLIHKLEQQIEKESKERKDRADADEQAIAATHAKSGGKTKPQPTSFLGMAESAGITGTEDDKNSPQGKIKRLQIELTEAKAAQNAIMAEINKDLELTSAHVLLEFSTLSGIPVNKLSQNETEKLLKLHTTLANRVFDQDEPVNKLAGAMKVAKTGLKDPNKPDAAFMFLGPSGTGKTELALALTQALYDDEKAILRLDMSEYSEKNAVAKLIGAPPGYEGFERGGHLTNAIRKNPRCVVLFDEIEKGDDSIFDILLQVLSAGRLTDNHGRVADFTQTTIIMTSNIGSKYFLDTSLTEKEAQEKAMADLKARYRPEFLNRFAGQRNIICFKKLQHSTIERIANRELVKLNKQLAAQGLGLNMAEDTIKEIVKTYYNPENGARGIAGFFETDITPIIADTILSTPNAKGIMPASLDPVTKRMIILPPVLAAANQNAGSSPAVTLSSSAKTSFSP